MKVLFIGGTGNISTSVSKLCVERGIELYHLNRGQRKVNIPGVKNIKGDIKNFDETSKILKDHNWDVVVNWIAFHVEDVERDYKLFYGKTKQYIFISSASVYQKPLLHPVITESTPLANPFWQYSRNKIACEETLIKYYRESGFPITIVRPSHTYDTIIPLSIGGGDYTVVDRIKRGEKIIVHGDGTSLWTVTHAEDFAKGFVGLMAHQQSIGHAFHITSDEILTWNQIHETIASALGVEAKIVHVPSDYLAAKDEQFLGGLIGDKAASVIFDNTKIKTFVPGFKAVIPFYVGIRRTLTWFESDPARMVINTEMNKFIDTIISEFEAKL